MLIGVATMLALASVPLFNGRVMALAEVRFNMPWLAFLALGMQILIINVIPQDAGGVHRTIHLGSYIVLAGFVIINRQIPFLWLIALGGSCNFAAIAANGGVMPASADALRAAGVIETPGEFINSTAVPDAKLQFLGDVFATPSWMHVNNVFSIGDVLIVIGALLAFHTICGSSAALIAARARARVRGALPSADPPPSEPAMVFSDPNRPRSVPPPSARAPHQAPARAAGAPQAPLGPAVRS